jgi:transcription elongation factor GreA
VGFITPSIRDSPESTSQRCGHAGGRPANARAACGNENAKGRRAMQKNPITPEGAARLREELIHLKSVERPAVIQAIATAREHGDLKENAEYHAARDKQSFIEGRIKEIEDKLARAEVIDLSKVGGDRVAFGATVKVSNADTGEEAVYKILGADESDLAKGSISVTSPLARSLIGKQIGDEVKVRMPGGERTYEILDITFG